MDIKDFPSRKIPVKKRKNKNQLPTIADTEGSSYAAGIATFGLKNRASDNCSGLTVYLISPQEKSFIAFEEKNFEF